MAKNTRGSKEFTREQKLIKENRQLKRELGHLRKQISRIDFDRIETVKQMCVDYEDSKKFKENVDEISSNIEDLRRQWACKNCEIGYLEITLYSKLGETFYFRKCNSCNNRTKGKRYDSESVKGILKNG